MATTVVKEPPQTSPQGSPQLDSASLSPTDQKVNETASLSLKSIWTTTASVILGTLTVLAIGVALGSNPAGWVVSALLIMKGVSMFFFGGSAIAYGAYKVGEMLEPGYKLNPLGLSDDELWLPRVNKTTQSVPNPLGLDDDFFSLLSGSQPRADSDSTHSASTKSDLDGVSVVGDDANVEVKDEKPASSSWGITSVASGIGSGLAYVWKVTKDFADQLEPDRN